MGEERKREHGFLFCVGAEQELARLCPGGDISRLREAMGNGADAMDFNIELLCILSRWHEKAQALEQGSGYEEKPLTREELLLLPLPAFKALQAQAMEAMLRDREQTVEAKAEKKRNLPSLS